jgi:glycosyltransferase involved in cell wall biosynthesis
VYGDLFRRILIDAGGYPENSVVVTGQPSHDVPYDVGQDAARERISQQLNLQPEVTTVVLAVQTRTGLAHDQNVKLVKTALETIRGFPEHRLLVKFYPRDDRPLRKRIAREKGLLDDLVFAGNVNLFDLLQACDLLVTSSPTVALEAMLFQKPVVTIDPTATGEMASYAESGASIGVTSPDELAQAIRSVLTDEPVRRKLDEGRTRFITDRLHPRDGNAARRVITLAIDMADDHARQAARSTQGEPE